MATVPPVRELEFLKLVPNHLELGRKLDELQLSAPALASYAAHVGIAWFRLGETHLLEAEAMLRLPNINRSIYSRAYYAAYNASKGVRYIHAGWVSLKGDDHKKVGELPGDFPGVPQWSQSIAKLYENRLRADYENWVATEGEFSQMPADAVKAAHDFIAVAKAYLVSKSIQV